MNLKKLTDNELVELNIMVRKEIMTREVSESTILNALKRNEIIGLSFTRYTKLTLLLEKEGFTRESIASRIVDMVYNKKLESQSGCPIGEIEKNDNPIYPVIESERKIHICYIKKS